VSAALDLGDACEAIHGLECEPAIVELPAEGETLVSLGHVRSISYTNDDGTEWTHPFPRGVDLWAWPDGIVVNAPVDETGIQDDHE